MSMSKNNEQNENETKRIWKYNVGDNIKDNKRDLIILDKEIRNYFCNGRTQKQKWYKLYCNKCNYNEIFIKEAHLNQKRGCPVCRGRQVVAGINDINTTANWMANYMEDKQNGQLFTKNSNVYINFKCPDCGDITSQKISNVYNFGFHCKNCYDGISYPNKFSYEFLRQLPVKNVIHEYTPNWANGKRYDNYFEYNGKSYILEMDGGFHYEYNTLSHKDAFIEQQNDKNKDLMANNHNIIVIRIKSVKNDLDYMIEQFKCNTLLNCLFDINNVDFKKCHEFAMSNITKSVCDYYNKCNDVNCCIEKFGLARITILSYLKNGYVLGWCDYTPQKSYKQRSLNRKSKQIAIIYNNKEIIYNSTKELCNDMLEKYGLNFKIDGVRQAAHKNKLYKKFRFKYV